MFNAIPFRVDTPFPNWLLKGLPDPVPQRTTERIASSTETHLRDGQTLFLNDLKNQICAIQHQGYNAFPSVDGSLLASEHKCEQ
jgi:hypothetical protein